MSEEGGEVDDGVQPSINNKAKDTRRRRHRVLISIFVATVRFILAIFPFLSCISFSFQSAFARLRQGYLGGKIAPAQPKSHIHQTDEDRNLYERTYHCGESLG